MGIQTGIDGYRLISSRTGEDAGIDEPEFEIDPNEPWHPAKATIAIYRFVNGERCKYVGEARWREYVQKKKDGTPVRMWSENGMPFNQLAKCAEAQARRKAFPQDLSGIYTHEEMPIIDIETVADTPEPSGPPAEQPKADSFVTGVLTAYTPGDSKAKKAHRFTFKTDEGADITLTAFERPETLRKEGAIKEAMGKRCQFKYEEKPNAKNPSSPYRNLTHFALEVLEPETETPAEEQPAQAEKAPEGVSPDMITAYKMLLDSADSEDMLNDLWNTIRQEMKSSKFSDADTKTVSDYFFSLKKKYAEAKGGKK